MLSLYEVGIVHGLVSKGYIVSAADANGMISSTYNNAASTMVALKVEKNQIAAVELLEDVRNVLKDMKALYYGVVVSEHTSNCTWLTTNITIDPPDELAVKAPDKKAN